MNEYAISVYLNAAHTMTSEMIVEAENKDKAIANAKKKCKDEGFTCYGWDYCDLA